MLKDISTQSIVMGILTAFVGFSSSFAVVLQGLSAVGATENQAVSGLMALSLAMGFCAIFLSVRSRLPVSIAWSTPGAALLVSTGAVEGGFAAAVGGFIVCAFLIILAGLWKPVGKAVSCIPAPLANAMLAGVLIGLCFAPFKAIAFNPLFGLFILISWIVVGAINRLWAVPAALAAFILIVIFGIDIPDGAIAALGNNMFAAPELVTPVFTLSGLFSIAIPLFIVTMASQNLPGIAVMQANKYPIKASRWFSVTGIFSLLSAPFGGHAVNLAAITAALCAGEDAHPDPAKRYWAVLVSGVFYIIFGLFSGLIMGFVILAPAILIQAVAGLALIAAFTGAARAAFEDEALRDAAAVTFLLSASGISLFGIAGAFWGLIAGGFIVLIKRLKTQG